MSARGPSTRAYSSPATAEMLHAIPPAGRQPGSKVWSPSGQTFIPNPDDKTHNHSTVTSKTTESRTLSGSREPKTYALANGLNRYGKTYEAYA